MHPTHLPLTCSLHLSPQSVLRKKHRLTYLWDNVRNIQKTWHHIIDGFVFKASKENGARIVSVSSSSLGYEWCMCMQAYWINSSSKWITSHCTADSITVAMDVIIEGKGFVSPFHCSLFIWLFLHRWIHTSAAGGSLNIWHVQQERVLWFHFFALFSGRSLRLNVWVGLSGPVTFCRNCDHESLMVGSQTEIVLVSACLLPPTLSWREMHDCVHIFVCVGDKLVFFSGFIPVEGHSRAYPGPSVTPALTHCHSHFWAMSTL